MLWDTQKKISAFRLLNAFMRVKRNLPIIVGQWELHLRFYAIFSPSSRFSIKLKLLCSCILRSLMTFWWLTSSVLGADSMMQLLLHSFQICSKSFDTESSSIHVWFLLCTPLLAKILSQADFIVCLCAVVVAPLTVHNFHSLLSNKHKNQWKCNQFATN